MRVPAVARKQPPELSLRSCRIGVIGLGYVGLPLAVEFGKHYDTVGFDINPERIAELQARQGPHARSGCAKNSRAAKRLRFTSELRDLQALPRLHRHRADADRRGQAAGPDAARARERVGRQGAEARRHRHLRIDRLPGLHRGDLRADPRAASRGSSSTAISFAGYSPERINPGDKRAPAADDQQGHVGLDAGGGRVRRRALRLDHQGRHAPASSIRVAEAAKVIENTQRDVNIALINELALIFNRLGIDTEEVLRGGRHQVELPAVPAGPRRRPLHRRRSVLPDAQGAGDRLSPRDDPRRAAHQRQHGALRRGRGRAPDDREAHPRRSPRASWCSGSRSRRTARTCATPRSSTSSQELKELRREGGRLRSLGQRHARRRHEYGIRLVKKPARGSLRRDRARRRPSRVPRHGHRGHSRRSPSASTCCTTSSTCSSATRPTGGSDARSSSPAPPDSSASTSRERLLARGDEVVGLDNLNDYYDPTLKQARLARAAGSAGLPLRARSTSPTARRWRRSSPARRFERVVHLAAQAGVRYSIENPHAYVDSNLVGTLHVLEGCRHHGVEHLVYASTSSVYGANTKMPFSRAPERRPSAVASTPRPRRPTS